LTIVTTQNSTHEPAERKGRWRWLREPLAALLLGASATTPASCGVDRPLTRASGHDDRKGADPVHANDRLDQEHGEER
jgi:hypothetical protein